MVERADHLPLRHRLVPFDDGLLRRKASLSRGGMSMSPVPIIHGRDGHRDDGRHFLGASCKYTSEPRQYNHALHHPQYTNDHSRVIYW